jgi:hypothetical protein
VDRSCSNWAMEQWVDRLFSWAHSTLNHVEPQQAWMFSFFLTGWIDMSTEGRVSNMNCPFPQIHWTRNPTVVLHKVAKIIFKTVVVFLARMPYTNVAKQNTNSISALPNVKLQESRYLRNVGPLSARGNILQDKIIHRYPNFS